VGPRANIEKSLYRFRELCQYNFDRQLTANIPENARRPSGEGEPMNSNSATSAKYYPALFGKLSGRWQEGPGIAPAAQPLIVAVHGGSYTSQYFDVPGYSLFAQAAAIGAPILALDRPGYGESVQLSETQSTLRGNAAFLGDALSEAWSQYRGSAPGIVLVAHSIGAAISMIVAGEKLDWPLLGLAISGVGLRTPPGHREAWAALPDTYRVEIPSAIKDQVMFGPAGSFDAAMPAASHIANAPAPKAELVDITSNWQGEVRDVASRINVPVHYRQGEFDGLWIVGEGEVRGFHEALTSAPFVDALAAPGVGHCIDFHKGGASFQKQQLAFAMRCATQGKGRDS
jgi:pimeloyl-ACP methyl ester carboxylesterase